MRGRETTFQEKMFQRGRRIRAALRNQALTLWLVENVKKQTTGVVEAVEQLDATDLGNCRHMQLTGTACAGGEKQC
jgi:hypothetical protein